MICMSKKYNIFGQSLSDSIFGKKTISDDYIVDWFGKDDKDDKDDTWFDIVTYDIVSTPSNTGSKPAESEEERQKRIIENRDKKINDIIDGD